MDSLSQQEKRHNRLLHILQYTNVACSVAILCALLFSHYWGFAILMILHYIFFGFVGLAHLLAAAQCYRLSYFFLCITCPHGLLPFTRAWYYLTRSQLLAFQSDKKGTNDTSVLRLAVRVNPADLLTARNRAFFYLHMTAIFYDRGNLEIAQYYYDIALCIARCGDTPPRRGMVVTFDS